MRRRWSQVQVRRYQSEKCDGRDEQSFRRKERIRATNELKQSAWCFMVFIAPHI
jgi:hypothetical protein